MKRGKRHKFLVLGILVGLGLSSFIACAIGAPTEQVQTRLSHLSLDQMSNFNEALVTLAAQGHVAIVAEGVPLHPLLSAQDALRLTTPLPLGDEVRAVAAAYDYDAQREGNVFVLTKRYSNPNDLPAITQAECINALEQMQKVAAPFDPDVPPNSLHPLTTATQNLSRDQYQIISPLLDPLAALLTADQLGEMSKNNLYYSSLTPQEQQSARRVLLYLYVQQTLEATSQIPSQIEQAEQVAVFGWADTSSARHIFGYVLPKVLAEPRADLFHPLSQSNSLDDLHITVIAPPTASPSGIDPTLPNPDSVPPTGGMTLADALLALNAQSKSLQAEVDPAIAAKPVMFAGLNNVPAPQALYALADMYDLRLTTSSANKQSRFLLTLPLVEPPASISALPAALRKCLPKPFIRATHIDQIVTDQQTFHNFWKPVPEQALPMPNKIPSAVEETSAELEQAMQTRQREVGGIQLFQTGQDDIKHAESTIPALRTAAIRRLRALIEPQLQGQAEGIPITKFGELEHEALATVFLAEAIQETVSILTQPVPDVVLDTNKCILGGGVTGTSSQPLFSVMFFMPTPNGKLQMNGMSGGVDYIKP